MDLLSLLPYEDAGYHLEISNIIHQFSINHDDPREVFLRGLDLFSVSEVLELGCGFGYMSEVLAEKVAPKACITGIDACYDNEVPFSKAVGSAKREGRFVCGLLEKELPSPDNSFEMVVSSYSLYFFMDILPEITRILKPDGLFVGVTHSNNSFMGLLRAIGISQAQSELNAIFRCFCSENGEDVLKKHFNEIQRIDYDNELRFTVEDIDYLMAYIMHKLPFLAPNAFRDENVQHKIYDSVISYLATNKEVLIEKNDTCFRCWQPKK